MGVVVRQTLVSDQGMMATHYTRVLIDGTVRRVSFGKSQSRYTLYYKGVVDAMCLQSRIYDVIVGNVQELDHPRVRKRNGNQTHSRAWLQPQRTSRGEKSKGATEGSKLDLEVTGEEWRKQQKEDMTLAHGWKMANEKKPARYTKTGCSKYVEKVVPQQHRGKVMPIAQESAVIKASPRPATRS